MLTLKHFLSSFFDINAYSFFYSFKVYFAFQLQCVLNSSVLFLRRSSLARGEFELRLSLRSLLL